MKKTLAMILAGGKGKRMDIFCHQRPKPILPFAGRYQVIDVTLSNCIHSQVKEIAALVDYQRSAMTDYLRKWDSSNRQVSGGLAILQPGSDSYKGTADAVYQNLGYLAKQSPEAVLILAGDHIYRMDYRKMLDFHHAVQADVTVGMVRVPIQEAHRFGTARVGPDGRVREFIEKSATPVSNLASMGIYIFNPDFLTARLKEDAADAGSPHDFGYAVLPRIVKADRVFGYEFSGYWQDIGTVEAYYEANMQLLESKPVFAIDESWPFLTINDKAGVASQTGNHVTNSLVSPGCVIEGYVENSILSPGVRVEEKARVVNSIVMANTRIGYHSVVDRCILDEGVNIDKFCYIGFGAAPHSQVGDITMVGKDVKLGSQIAIGRKSKIMPGLKLADLKSRFVAPGTVISVPV